MVECHPPSVELPSSLSLKLATEAVQLNEKNIFKNTLLIS